MTTKLYYKDGTVVLDGFTFYLSGIRPLFRDRKNDGTVPDYCVNFKAKSTLCDDVTFCQKDLGTIPQDSSIYIFPQCPYAAADVRAHYKVKRDIDSGDYNVFVPLLSWHWKASVSVRTILYWPDRRIALGLPDCYRNTKDCAGLIRNYVPDMSEDEAYANAQYLGNNIEVYWLNDPRGFYHRVLAKTLTKPLVSVTQLNITNNNKLTSDVLQLVYETIRTTSKYSIKENIVVQLNLLNQYNWREYPGTMTVFSQVCHYCDSFTEMWRTSSKYSKPVRELLKIPMGTFSTQKDLELAQTFLYSILQFRGTRFVKTSDLAAKCRNIGLSLPVFEQVFDSITKVSPKRIEENGNEELE